MAQRISQLEVALQTEFHTHSEGVHPLLTDELLDLKTRTIGGDRPDEDEDLKVINAMGLLAIDEPEEDAENYFGATGKEVWLSLPSALF